MKTYQIIIIFVVAVVAAISIILFQTFKVKRVNTVYQIKGMNICFVADENYTFTEKAGGFDYFAGENKGEVRLIESPSFSKDFTQSKVNGIDYAYFKDKNFRTYEYRVGKDLILRDYFLYKKRAPVHITPYRDECSEMRDLYKVVEIGF